MFYFRKTRIFFFSLQKKKVSEINKYLEAKKNEYLKDNQNHSKLRTYRMAFQKKMIEAKKNQSNSNYRTSNFSMSSIHVSF